MAHITLTNGHDPVADAALAHDPIVNPAALNALRMLLDGELEHHPDLPVYSREWLLMRDAIKFANTHDLQEWTHAPEYAVALSEWQAQTEAQVVGVPQSMEPVLHHGHLL